MSEKLRGAYTPGELRTYCSLADVWGLDFQRLSATADDIDRLRAALKDVETIDRLLGAGWAAHLAMLLSHKYEVPASEPGHTGDEARDKTSGITNAIRGSAPEAKP